MVDLLRLLWLFNTSEPAQGTLTKQAAQAEFAAPANTTNGFTVRLTVDLKEFKGTKEILQIPDVLRVILRQHDPRDRNRQNYPAFKMPDGSVPVLEATIELHSAEHPDWNEMTIGIPLAMLKNPDGEHEVVLSFSGPSWEMYVDGQLLDNDFPFGYPQWKEKNTWSLYPAYTKKASIHLPAIKPAKQVQAPSFAPEIQYWMPPGHNNWVGDVATIHHQRRYHVFYLCDRRHHQSKFGCGGHYFEHLSTTDFKTWTEHEAATPLEEQWETIGTGAPLAENEKLYLTYSVLTERMYPEHKTTYPAQQEYLIKHGCTGCFEQRHPKSGIFPAGSTYASSPDGIAPFQKTWKFFHTCGDPMVYTESGGKLRMTAGYGRNGKGTWESESIDGGWRCINPGFPPGGDCTFFFRWGKFDYIIGGFTGLWFKRADAPDKDYEDVVVKGLDFYDGLGVPAISEIDNGRFLEAGWFGFTGHFGGPLVIRELIQFSDGRIGSKWMPEVTPATELPKALAATVAGTATYPVDAKSFMLVFNVQPAETKKGRLGISFMPEKDAQPSCELQIRLDDLRAQFASCAPNGFAGDQKSLRERNSPARSRDYAIENLIGVDKPFTVRVIVKPSDKMGGSLIDAEIAGQRTMLTFRPDLSTRKVLLRTEGVELKNVQIAPLKNK